MKNKSFGFKAALVALIIVLCFLAPLVVKDPYLLHIAITIFIWSVLTLGIRTTLIIGHLNAAQASFMGMGAYFSALLAMKLKLSFWICLPAAGLGAALLSLPLGYPILRLKGAYFVMITFAITEVFRHIWMMWKSLFGGPQGLLGIPRPGKIELAGLTIAFTSKVPFYYLALILLLLTLLIMYRLDRSRMGLTMRAIPQTELLAESVGVPVIRYKVMAFVIGSFFAGLAGSFWAHYFTYASPWDFTWMNSQYMLMYAVIGGMGTVLGPIIGCVVMLGLDELFRPFKQYMPIFMGAVLIIVLLYVPGGLIALPQRLRATFSRRKP